ncbi:phosphonate degradation HD-domain oxygenase [Deminuibacter soli]|uniref:HDIG domain-containing protein n=1 Tax=Deminuibacter soli TaxID=2291815 RepID=A0A3E1NDL2_9BACT|nr:phosphonate degradation HD-domain oxygenase [Deminuibacter soli]RFM26030.1 HDIG domain-containing protein [Deminuibacter soli]
MIHSDKNQQIAAGIMQLFKQHGAADYDGEPVTQSSHMIQCAMQALAEGGDMELVLGAFLHDIGHLLKHEQPTEAMGDYGVVNHEGIGAAYLKQHGFSDRICAMVDMHVQAKRYLVATDPGYRAKLSPASLQTLEWQGGPMSDTEAAAFSRHPFFEDIIKVRRWDELAKSTDTVLLPLSHFEKMMVDYLNDN